MSRLGVVKKVLRITLKTLKGVKHLKIHYQIKFHHIRCNSLADMASLPIPNSLSLVLYIYSSVYPSVQCFFVLIGFQADVEIALTNILDFDGKAEERKIAHA